MENVQTILDDMQLRRPKQIAQVGIGLGVEDEMLLGGDQSGDGIRLTDVQAVVAVQVIGGNEVVLAVPLADGGIGLVPRHGEFVPILMDAALHVILAGGGEIHIIQQPVDGLFHRRAVGVTGNSLHLTQVRCRGCLHAGGNLVGHVYGGGEAVLHSNGDFLGDVDDSAGDAALGQVKVIHGSKLAGGVSLCQVAAGAEQIFLGEVDQIGGGEVQQLALAGCVRGTVHLNALSKDVPHAVCAGHPWVTQGIGMQHILLAGNGLGIHNAGVMQQGQTGAAFHKGKMNAVRQLGGVQVFGNGLAGVIEEFHQRPPLFCWFYCRIVPRI